MTQKVKEQIRNSLENLEVKKLFKINENGNKIKVRRDNVDEYSIYRNGHFVTTDASWQAAYELMLVLINTK